MKMNENSIMKKLSVAMMFVTITLFVTGCALIEDFKKNYDDVSTAPNLVVTSPADGTVLKAGETYDFSFTCKDENLDKVRIRYFVKNGDVLEEIEYEYIYKTNGKFERKVRIPLKAEKVYLETPNADGELITKQRYEVTGTKKFSSYTIPTSYDAAYTYRTNTPYAAMEAIVNDATFEAKRVSDPLGYIEAVSAKIKETAQNDFEKVKMVHDLLTLLIPYDVDGAAVINTDKFPPQDYYTVLKNKIAVCQGYAVTFNKFCEVLGIECDYVFGYEKKISTHAWDIVKIDGKCYFVDCTWDAGSGVTQNDNTIKFEANYSTKYLFLKPELFGLFHYPEDSKHQLLANPVSLDDFKAYPDITIDYFEAVENPENNALAKLKGVVSSADGTYSFNYKMKNPNQMLYIQVMKLSAEDNLYYEIKNAFAVESGDNENTVKFSFPESTKYKIKITLLSDASSKGPVCATFYLDAAKASAEKYVEVNYPLVSVTPTAATLKRGETYSFKVNTIKDVDVYIAYYSSEEPSSGKNREQLTKAAEKLSTGNYSIPSTVSNNYNVVTAKLLYKGEDGLLYPLATYSVTE